jgi:hypothetical protein
MKKLGLLLPALLLAACGQQQIPTEQPPPVPVEASAPANDITNEASEVSAVPAESRLAEARAQVEEWHKGTLKQQKFLEDAFRNNEIQTLERESLSMLGTQLPGGDRWQLDEFAPYLKCDTAWNDLGLYASAMHNALRDPKAVTRKILAQEKEDYERSLAYCEKRLKMAPAEAWKHYEEN